MILNLWSIYFIICKYSIYSGFLKNLHTPDKTAAFWDVKKKILNQNKSSDLFHL